MHLRWQVAASPLFRAIAVPPRRYRFNKAHLKQMQIACVAGVAHSLLP
jgi:hypothetical protein